MSLQERVRNLEVGTDIEITVKGDTFTATVTDHEGETGHGTYYEVNIEGENGGYYNLAIESATEAVHLNGDGHGIGEIEELTVLD